MPADFSNRMKKTNKAIFLDRDGTIIHDKEYLHKPEDVELIPGADNALRHAIELGYLLFLFTNQSGIGRKYYSMEDAVRVNDRMIELLGLPSPGFSGICIAPEIPEEPSRYRKPSPNFILEMIAKHHLDPDKCCMIGDKKSDVLAGLNAGIRSVAVLTGKEKEQREREEMAGWQVEIYPSLKDFVDSL